MPRTFSLLLLVSVLGLAVAQTPGKLPEKHPKIDTWECTKKKGCVKQTSALVLDALAHPVHQKDNPSLGCGDWGSGPNATICPDAASCAKNCIVEGISDYTTYGVSTKGSNLYMKQLRDDGSSASPRVYLLAENEKKYEMLQLTGRELAFDVDVSKLPCGMNSALYLSEMEDTGGQSRLNPGGAYYGTGYCDAQCFTTPFINGVANIAGKGSCCNEMDIWEANARATQLAPHTCNQTSLYQCTGAECAFDGVCDKNGCGQNPYGLGNKAYYGPGLKVNTKRPFTVVTQFPAERGVLKEIRRLYVQDGKIIQNSASNVTGVSQNYINDDYCQKTGAARFTDLGALKGMGDALSRGMVLIFSIWWDEGGFMNWLDSGSAGPCNATEGAPSVIRQVQPDTAVTFSNIKWGEIGSTYSGR
ncbi:glycosyl hydrolase family 7 protein [Phlyctema vagabunda]|uniref:Glucanase n=1 Tax=Phlyctema vagabunda TaxID=108571 RepID=A0ABR4P7I1_9HELO